MTDTDSKPLARELLTAYWTARERDTEDAWRVCRETLVRVLGEPLSDADVIAGEVVAEIAALATVAIAALADAHGEDVADTFATFLHGAREDE